MKTAISAHTKNHTFRLAEGLEKLGVFENIFSLYPNMILREYEISSSKIISYSLLASILFLTKKLKIKIPDRYFSQTFDHCAAHSLKRRKNNIDLIHGLSGYCLNTIKKAKENNIKTIVDRACPHIDFQYDLLNEEYERLLNIKNAHDKTKWICDKMRAEYALADRIIVPSSYSYQSFIDRGFSTNKVKIAPISKEKNTTITADSHREKQTKTFVALAIGFNFIRKGFYYLLKAWNELNLPNAKLIIRSPIPDAFLSLAQKNNITVLGHLNNAALINLYHQADLFCLPSVDEGFGMVALEAMAAGLPIIVTENVGMKDLITDGKEGFIIPIRDIEKIKESILKIYTNLSLREQMSEQARKTEQQHCIENYAKRILSIYQDILKCELKAEFAFARG